MPLDLRRWVGAALEHHEGWEGAFGPYTPSADLAVDDDLLASAFAELFSRLEENYPFFHPRYAGQMLKPPHAAAVVAYLAAMLVNPNNHALDGGPATARMELECVEELSRLTGFPAHIGHLTSSGTMANLEALFIARSLHPGLGVAFSEDAHYTHGRMCHLLGLRAHTVGTDTSGRIDLDEVEALASAGLIGTVVVTAGTTGLGAVDRVEGAVALKDRYGLRVHVDGAYGGFFAVLAKDTAASGLLGLDPRPWSAIAECDSFVVDPHKHGLQPYGCGAVLFSDPSVARHYAHDSPYTYFTGGGAAHLGEISLECSRAGAAAAAFWLTLRLFPLTTSGLGRVLAATRRAASSFARLLEASEELCLYQEPELDIVAYFASLASPAELDAVSEELLSRAMTASDPVFLSTLRVKASDLARRHPSFSGMQEQDDLRVRILRSVLMKPESEAFVPALMGRLESLVAELVD